MPIINYFEKLRIKEENQNIEGIILLKNQYLRWKLDQSAGKQTFQGNPFGLMNESEANDVNENFITPMMRGRLELYKLILKSQKMGLDLTPNSFYKITDLSKIFGTNNTQKQTQIIKAIIKLQEINLKRIESINTNEKDPVSAFQINSLYREHSVKLRNLLKDSFGGREAWKSVFETIDRNCSPYVRRYIFEKIHPEIKSQAKIGKQKEEKSTIESSIKLNEVKSQKQNGRQTEKTEKMPVEEKKLKPGNEQIKIGFLSKYAKKLLSEESDPSSISNRKTTQIPLVNQAIHNSQDMGYGSEESITSRSSNDPKEEILWSYSKFKSPQIVQHIKPSSSWQDYLKGCQDQSKQLEPRKGKLPDSKTELSEKTKLEKKEKTQDLAQLGDAPRKISSDLKDSQHITSERTKTMLEKLKATRKKLGKAEVNGSKV